MKEGRGGTCRFGMIRDKNDGGMPGFAEIRCLEERCEEQIDVLLAIATGV